MVGSTSNPFTIKGHNMTKQEQLQQHMNMAKIIHASIQASKDAGCTVEINQNLPSVFIDLGEGNEYFFQEHEASELLIQADFVANTYGIWASDALLWLSQGW